MGNHCNCRRSFWDDLMFGRCRCRECHECRCKEKSKCDCEKCNCKEKAKCHCKHEGY